MEKCSPFGVTVPPSSWCGVRACEVRNSPFGLLSARTTFFSNGEGVWTGGVLLKYRDDLERVAGEEAERLVSEAKTTAATA